MDNEDFTLPEAENPEVSNENTEFVTEEITEQAPEETFEEPVQQIVEPEMEPGVYRGRGAGRKESPFADSPYVMHHKPQEPVFPEPQPERIPEKPRKKKSGSAGKRILPAPSSGRE